MFFKLNFANLFCTFFTIFKHQFQIKSILEFAIFLFKRFLNLSAVNFMSNNGTFCNVVLSFIIFGGIIIVRYIRFGFFTNIFIFLRIVFYYIYWIQFFHIKFQGGQSKFIISFFFLRRIFLFFINFILNINIIIYFKVSRNIILF